ncbi:hypothetical protein A2856_00985 [Candidatus Uhrbacteria bacterium RIFCSPHIGHO2_01_FULL_63_20]|uniref:NYN domain-containing protein n=1 Tax=Candidatus Uhrbacteria bacterium RIFCSPHIGHO2_01_FULL_63_20 TaxID=1802385 RepID=A0A1F7TM47_9BACT|nr:MAG: hypothetical protein A2856_00985 [Candidatus Uhrbacteria bacterium RIFCSPHIGHO2_01_FULL_63_20]
MYYSARYLFGRKVSFTSIVEDAVAKRRLIRAIAYVVSTKGQEEQPFFEALQKAGIELREKELMEYSSGQKKADWDVGLAVDVIRMLDMLDVVVIVSGDGDFQPLIEYAKSRGRIVEVMSFRETTSGKIPEAADRYVNLSDDKKRYLLGGLRLKSAKAQEDVRTALERSTDSPEGVSAPGALKRKPSAEPPEERRRRRLSF